MALTNNSFIKKKSKEKIIKESNGSLEKISAFEYIGAIIIVMGLISMILPFVWMVLSSLKTTTEFYDATWMPQTFIWDNYKSIFSNKEMNFALYLFNTVKVAGFTIIGKLFASSLVAYALARLEFPGKKILFSMILLIMFLPKQVTIVPVFVLIKKMGLYNSHLSLILPAFLGVPGGAMLVFLLKQFFASIPKSYEESAMLDGANTFQIFYKIFLPMMKAPLITCAILTLQTSWAEILRPLIFLKDDKLYTLVLGIKRISDVQFMPKPELEMAGYIVLLLPLVFIYIIAQKYFTESINSTGVKG